LIREGRAAVLLEGAPGGELKGNELEAFVEPLSGSGFELEVMGVAIADVGGQRQTEGPIEAGGRLGRLNRERVAVVDAQLHRLSPQRPARGHGSLQRTEPGPSVATAAADLLQHLVALGVEPHRAAGQFGAVGGIEEDAQHQAMAAGWQFEAGDPPEAEAAIGLDALGAQVGAAGFSPHTAERDRTGWI